MVDLPRKLKESYRNDSIILWLNGLENEEYAFCWGDDFIKSYESVTIDTSSVNGLGLGCGVLRFWLNDIHYKFEYHEMIGLWLETKDAKEDSPEEVKQKIISFGQKIFDELVRKEDERKAQKY